MSLLAGLGAGINLFNTLKGLGGAGADARQLSDYEKRLMAARMANLPHISALQKRRLLEALQYDPNLENEKASQAENAYARDELPTVLGEAGLGVNMRGILGKSSEKSGVLGGAIRRYLSEGGRRAAERSLGTAGRAQAHTAGALNLAEQGYGSLPSDISNQRRYADAYEGSYDLGGAVSGISDLFKKQKKFTLPAGFGARLGGSFRGIGR